MIYVNIVWAVWTAHFDCNIMQLKNCEFGEIELTQVREKVLHIENSHIYDCSKPKGIYEHDNSSLQC
jgi:hypothetical protein